MVQKTQDASLLERINSPSDLKKLPQSCLESLAQEARAYLIQALRQCGGHFGGSLGTVELSIALHYLFDTPNDRIIWDVGHQAYIHKMLTGRREALSTIRQHGGLSPFPKRSESPYDAFGVGHSSTSISAAVGMAIASARNHQKRHVVAVIGDGAMTAGLAFEALNHAGAIGANVLVVLNDNDMSISENVGALSNYFARILSGRIVKTLKKGSEQVLSKMPPVWEFAKRAKDHMKQLMVPPGTLFEELGLQYVGPIDGHNIHELLGQLRQLQTIDGPRLLHIVTKKGKGYPRAEADPIGYHAVSAHFDQPAKNHTSPTSSTSPSYAKVFGDWLCDMAAHDPRLVAITPAMREGSGMVRFSQCFKERYFDVGIAEQHSVTLAAGLACEGQKPVVAIYSSFLQRAYDQLIHDVALQNLPVLFAIDRAGVVGGDGPTHNGAFDLSYLRTVPNMTIMAPSDENECRQMLTTGFYHDGPCAVRYPRGKGPGVPIEHTLTTLPIGRAQVKRTGKTVAFLAFGSMLSVCQQAAEAFDASVINMRFIKPLDHALLEVVASEHCLLVTVEENAVMGGAGSSVNDYLQSRHIACACLNLGLPDRFVSHGDPSRLLAECQLDCDGIIQAVKRRLAHVDNVATSNRSQTAWQAP